MTKPKSHPKPPKGAIAKITDKTIEKVIRMRGEGLSFPQIAEKIRITSRTGLQYHPHKSSLRKAILRYYLKYPERKPQEPAKVKKTSDSEQWIQNYLNSGVRA